MSDLLRSLPENPIPDNAVSGMFTAADGCRLRYALFPKSQSVGTLVILPGRNECIEKYFETANDLGVRGFASAIMDLRGQGGSDRLLRSNRAGHVRSFDDYVSDLDTFFRQVVLPDCRPPYYILGHSTGGLIALMAAPDLVNRVRRMVLMSPLLAMLPADNGRWTRLFIKTSNSLGLGRLPVPGRPLHKLYQRRSDNPLTSDTIRFNRNQALAKAFPELFVGKPTIGWVNSAWRAINTISSAEFCTSVRLPTLFLAAGLDMVVSTRTTEHYAKWLRAGKTITIDGARHEILQERNYFREQALTALTVFLGVRSQESQYAQPSSALPPYGSPPYALPADTQPIKDHLPTAA